MKKIAYLIPEFPTQTHVFFWREIKALEGIGRTIKIFSTREPDSKLSPHAFSGEARARTTYLFPPKWGAAIRILASRPARSVKALAYILSLNEASLVTRLRMLGFLPVSATLVAECERSEITHIHCHSVANSAHITKISSLLSGMTFSHVVHGDLVVYGTDHSKKFSGASFIVSVNTPLVEQIKKACPEADVLIATMGVDTQKFCPQISKTYELGATIKLITVSRLHEVKGQQHLIEAVRKVLLEGMDVKLSIIGDGPYRQELDRLINDNGLRESVFILGSMSEDDILRYLHGSDIFCLASFGLGESAPVVVKEAMACGLPVVATRIGATTDMISDGIDGILVEQKNPAQIVDAIKLLVSDSNLRKKIGISAREKAIREFDSTQIAQTLADKFDAQSRI